MSDSKAYYRKLKHYKYKLVQDYKVNIDIEVPEDIDTEYIALTTSGLLTVKNRYAWDGPSGPTVDTKSFMRGSLVHDALYQLMREEHIDYKKHRKYADELLKEMCIEDGMSRFRAWYVFKFVHKYGLKSAMPTPKQEPEIIIAP